MISRAYCTERVAKQWQLQPDGFPEFRRKNQEMGKQRQPAFVGQSTGEEMHRDLQRVLLELQENTDQCVLLPKAGGIKPPHRIRTTLRAHAGQQRLSHQPNLKTS